MDKNPATKIDKAETSKSKAKKAKQNLVQVGDGQFALDLGKTQSEQMLEGQQTYYGMTPESTKSVCASLENYQTKAKKCSPLLDANRSIVMSNEFVISVEGGSSLAARLVRVAIGAIPMDAEELPETKITTTDFAALNLTAQRLTGHARKVLEDVLSYRIILVSMDKLKEPQKLTGINVFSYATLIPGEGAIVVQLNPVLKEHFLALRSDFTRYKLQEITELNTFASIKLHELLLSYVRKYDNHLVRFNLHTLSVMLGYKPKSEFRASTFFNTTLKRALEEINAHTSIQVKAVPVYPTKSRSYTDVRFYIDDWETIAEKQSRLAWEDRLRNGPDSPERKIIIGADAEVENKLKTGEGELCPEDIRSDKHNHLPSTR